MKNVYIFVSFGADCQNSPKSGLKTYFESSWVNRGSEDLKGFHRLRGREQDGSP
jgi:hypothetical protein